MHHNIFQLKFHDKTHLLRRWFILGRGGWNLFCCPGSKKYCAVAAGLFLPTVNFHLKPSHSLLPLEIVQSVGVTGWLQWYILQGWGDYNVSITRYLAQVSAPIYSRGQNWNCQVLILGHSTSGGSIKVLSRGDRWRREEGGREGVTHIHKNYPLNLDKSPSLVLISD